MTLVDLLSMLGASVVGGFVGTYLAIWMLS
jgi:hypothetical protein